MFNFDHFVFILTLIWLVFTRKLSSSHQRGFVELVTVILMQINFKLRYEVLTLVKSPAVGLGCSAFEPV